jgi:hypothetical protein
MQQLPSLAEERERLAKTMPAESRRTLIEIACGWRALAGEAERQAATGPRPLGMDGAPPGPIEQTQRNLPAARGDPARQIKHRTPIQRLPFARANGRGAEAAIPPACPTSC